MKEPGGVFSPRSVDEIERDGIPLRKILRAHEAWLLSNGKRGNKANLPREFLVWAELRGVNLQRADLWCAHLANANLQGANLRGACLEGADLAEADLSGADLSGAFLIRAHLCSTRVAGANFDQAVFGGTQIVDCDLSSAIGLDAVNHAGPSIMSVDTILKSRGRVATDFLRGSGLPPPWTEFVESFAESPTPFGSCCIAHSRQDSEFAERLCAELRAKGLRCWHWELGNWGLAPTVAGGGFDKVVIVCSKNSLKAVGHDYYGSSELADAMAREEIEKRAILLSITTDDCLSGKSKDEPWDEDKACLIARLAAGFSEPGTYEENLDRLLDALSQR